MSCLTSAMELFVKMELLTVFARISVIDIWQGPKYDYAKAATRVAQLKKLFLKTLQYSQENSCAGVSFK